MMIITQLMSVDFSYNYSKKNQMRTRQKSKINKNHSNDIHQEKESQPARK